MSLPKKLRSRKIGRNCRALEVSATGSDFSTGTYIDRTLLKTLAITASINVPPCWMLISRVLVLALIISPSAFAQLPPVQAPRGWGQVPQGTGACSVEKSCADLAPGMIQKALGPSPLRAEIRALSEILKGHGASAGKSASDWAVKAFSRAGADEIHAEELGPAAPFASVVAEFRGREHPDDYVLIAAPLEISANNPLETAANAAVLIDAVRVIHASGSVPRRSIRFVLFAAEGDGANQPSDTEWGYIRRHSTDLDRIAGAFAIDDAGGALDGFSLEDRPEMLAALKDALAPLRPLGIRDFTEGINTQSPVMPFWLEGIPTITATSSPRVAGRGRPPNSAPASLDSAKLQALKRSVAVAAISAYALADAESRIGIRRSRLEVEHSIRSHALEPQLKSSGLWNRWQEVSATRGK